MKVVKHLLRSYEAGDENFVKSVLVGWSGIKDADGNELEYNEDNLEAILDNHLLFLEL